MTSFVHDSGTYRDRALSYKEIIPILLSALQRSKVACDHEPDLVIRKIVALPDHEIIRPIEAQDIRSLFALYLWAVNAKAP